MVQTAQSQSRIRTQAWRCATHYLRTTQANVHSSHPRKLGTTGEPLRTLEVGGEATLILLTSIYSCRGSSLVHIHGKSLQVATHCDSPALHPKANFDISSNSLSASITSDCKYFELGIADGAQESKS